MNPHTRRRVASVGAGSSLVAAAVTGVLAIQAAPASAADPTPAPTQTTTTAPTQTASPSPSATTSPRPSATGRPGRPVPLPYPMPYPPYGGPGYYGPAPGEPGYGYPGYEPGDSDGELRPQYPSNPVLPPWVLSPAPPQYRMYGCQMYDNIPGTPVTYYCRPEIVPPPGYQAPARPGPAYPVEPYGGPGGPGPASPYAPPAAGATPAPVRPFAPPGTGIAPLPGAGAATPRSTTPPLRVGPGGVPLTGVPDMSGGARPGSGMAPSSMDPTQLSNPPLQASMSGGSSTSRNLLLAAASLFALASVGLFRLRLVPVRIEDSQTS